MQTNPHYNNNRGLDMKVQTERGFTMIEMLVALLITGIFFSIFAGVVLATFETLQTGDERTVAQQNARMAINYIANDIRHAEEIAPLRIEAYKDYSTGGFPIFDDNWDPFLDSEAWPIYRRSVDGAPGDLDGYIDLDIEGGSGDGNEYEEFNGDPNYDYDLPYDVRALAPNRISLLFQGDTYYPNTEYWLELLDSRDIDADGGPSFANATAAMTRVTYEHQLVESLGPDLYDAGGNFYGREKGFNMAVNRTDGQTIDDTAEFVIVRSFSVSNPTVSNPDFGDTAELADGDLGAIDTQFQMDTPQFRQPVADHVINIRFRYWHISSARMFEIRFDPDTRNIAPSGITPDDGYYRYFDMYGNEIYVYYNWDPSEMREVPLLPQPYDEDDWDAVPENSFLINGGPDGDDRTEQGYLLFEGWRFVNAVSITVKTANNSTLDIFRSTINHNLDPLVPTDYDYGMGFIDFGFDDVDDIGTNTLNEFQPLYQGADNIRASTSEVNGVDVFDFVEPNMNPNYDTNAFITLQTLVAPPSLKERADRAKSELLTYGFWHKYMLGC